MDRTITDKWEILLYVCNKREVSKNEWVPQKLAHNTFINTSKFACKTTARS